MLPSPWPVPGSIPTCISDALVDALHRAIADRGGSIADPIVGDSVYGRAPVSRADGVLGADRGIGAGLVPDLPDGGAGRGRGAGLRVGRAIGQASRGTRYAVAVAPCPRSSQADPSGPSTERTSASPASACARASAASRSTVLPSRRRDRARGRRLRRGPQDLPADRNRNRSERYPAVPVPPSTLLPWWRLSMI